MNTYLVTLYSKSRDHFSNDYNREIFSENDLAHWIQQLPNYHNKAYQVDDFEIVSMTKIGE